MPEIGATLREARMRAHLDVAQLEAQTKIRAKYLRALENEEWEALPGPTYVRSFLRSYADELGLDGKLLVEEYRLRHEQAGEQEPQPISPAGARARRERQRRGPGAVRDVTVALVVVGLVAALVALGRSGSHDPGSGGGPGPPTPAGTSSEPTSGAGQAKRQGSPPHRRRARTVRLELVATAPVYVCLQAGRRVLVGQAVLRPGERRGPYRAKRFTMTFGNSGVRMIVDGHPLAVPPTSTPLGYALTPRGRTTLSPGRRPTCAG